MRLLTALLLASCTTLAGAAGNVVLVTAVEGSVQREDITSGKVALEAFTRLSTNDRLIFPSNSKASLIYVQNGRLEQWQGAGSVQVGSDESKALAGKPALQIRRLPPDVTRQMNRTPSPQDGRAGMVRLAEAAPTVNAEVRAERGPPREIAEASRASEEPAGAMITKSARSDRGNPLTLPELPPPSSPANRIEQLESTYRTLRGESPTDDLTPEIFLLAGLFDLRQYERIGREFQRLAEVFPKDSRVELLRQNYRRAILKANRGDD